MAPSGPLFTAAESKALLTYVQIFVHAAEVGRASRFDGLTPSKRWKQFGPADAAAKLPSRVANTLARYAWHRAGGPAAADAIALDLQNILANNGLELSNAELQGALLAGAYWLNRPTLAIFSDDAALVAVEDFMAFVSGFMQTLPPRFAPNEHPDSRNRRFRAYQRRRNGTAAAVRSPKSLVNRLPENVGDLLEHYKAELLSDAPSSMLLAENLSIALGHPGDAVVVAQFEIALATAAIWQNLINFVVAPASHPLLGLRPDMNAEAWNASAVRIARARQILAENQTPGIDPKLFQSTVMREVGGVSLDEASVDALSLLDDYVTAFASWIRSGAANDFAPEQRVAVFDRTYRRIATTATITGASVAAELPPNAMKVIAHVDALIARQRDIAPIALQLATALGDQSAANRLRRTLETVASWLNGSVSRLERYRTDSPMREVAKAERDPATTEAFTVARQRDAESLLDLGASVAELVRFAQKLDDTGRPPAGWWTKFHSYPPGDYPLGASQLLDRLPDGSTRLLKQYARLLTNETSDDLAAAATALAGALGRDAEMVCIRTLAVGLSVGAVWQDLDRISRGRRSDSLLGAEPSTAEDRLLCGRAQSQLEWGLQELLHTDSVPGV